MNGVKNETHVRVEQTARGIWYCTGLDVYGDNSAALKTELTNTMSLVEDILMSHNGSHSTEEQHADLTTSLKDPATRKKANT